MSESNCNLVLKRLKSLQISQVKSNNIFDDFLNNVKSTNANIQDSIAEDSNNYDENSISLQDCIDYFGDQSFPILNEQNNECIAVTANVMTTNNPQKKCPSNVKSKCDGNDLDIASSTVAKPFLKKGHGTARYKMKKLKQFHKRNVKINGDHDQKSFEYAHTPKLSDTKNIKSPLNKHNGFSKFEILEELITHESFCSTSSKIANLLEEPSPSSTPLRINLPDCSSEFVNQKCFDEDHSSFIQNIDEKRISGNASQDSTPSGILRRVTPIRNSPAANNVKFQQMGEVLEYTNSQFSNNSFVLEDDSEVISTSDLEHLALFNSKYKGFVDVLKNKQKSNVAPLSLQNQFYDGRSNIIGQDIKEYSNSNSEACKYLLLSKVQDLNKEIKIFRDKNEKMEILISDIQLQKQALNDIQANKDKTSGVISNSVNERKLKVLSDRLKKLKNENDMLKTNICELENREKQVQMIRRGLENTKKPKKSIIKQKTYLKEENMSNNINTISETFARNKILSCKTKTVNFSLDTKSTKQTDINPEKDMISNTHSFTNASSIYSDNSKSQHIDVEPPYFSKNCNCIKINQSNAKFIELKNLQAPIVHNTSLNTIVDNISCSGGTDKTSASKASTKPRIYEKIDILSGQYQSDSTSSSSDITERISIDPQVKSYNNGNTKTILNDKIIYFYAKEKVTKTLFKEDGRKQIDFANGQKEVYYKNGSFQIFSIDGSSKSFYADGTVTLVCADGTVTKTDSSGCKIIHFPNGQKEVHEDNIIKRIYPNGTLKTILPGGGWETRYPNGVVRRKAPDGTISFHKKD